MSRFLFYLLPILFTIQLSAQCNVERTITICDMTTVDIDDDGSPDGFINLYKKYNALPDITPIPEGTGYWFDPGYNYALEEDTGILHLWDLSESSTVVDTYKFQLFDVTSSCPDGLLVTLTVVLGPFSGFAVPTIGDEDVNVEVCDAGIDPCGSSSHFDLYQALLSTPSPHVNGIWHYEGSSPYFMGISENRYLLVNIPYEPGPPLVDEAIFELIYTVPGISPCDASVDTYIKVSVIRSVFSGAANRYNICEYELLAGDFDGIDLRDDEYLINEDIEGIWLAAEDPTGQITGPADSIINLSEVHADLVATNPRFGCALYEYSYFVQSRSAVCPASQSDVAFRFFEEIRPFQQDEPKEYCLRHIEEPTVNLYDLITFTTESGTLFDYPNNSCTDWEFISGPSDLGLVSNMGDLCDVLYEPDYTALGTVNIGGLTDEDVGTYIFEYTVLPEYNCAANLVFPAIENLPPYGCEPAYSFAPPCAPYTTQVTLIIFPYNYPGEDTDLEFCETDISVNLFDLLEVDPLEPHAIYTGPDSYWENLDTGEIIESIFDFPEIDGEQTFNLRYHITANNCLEEAFLTFTVFEETHAGENLSIEVCAESESFLLFDLLEGDPDTNGTWTLPDETTTDTNELMIDPATFESGDYIYNVPTNGPCEGSQATVSLIIYQELNPGEDIEAIVCKTDDEVNLISLLDASADSGGTFIDVDSTGSLIGSVFSFDTLSIGVCHFQYEVQASPSCVVNSSVITITIIETPIPIAENQSFCLSDEATISDLVVTTDLTFNWYASETSTSALALGSLLQDTEDYFVTATNDEGCVSESVQIFVTLTAPDVPSVDDQTYCYSDFPTLADLYVDTDLGYNWYESATAIAPLDSSVSLVNTEDYFISVTDSGGCISSRVPIIVTLTIPDAPIVTNQTFCISDEATLEDLIVSSGLTINWYASDTDSVTMDITELLEDETTYYLTGTDVNGCVSDFAELLVLLNQFGLDCDNENPIDEVVSPDDNNQNDELDLYELPLAFPNFEIKIFNRYGTVVYVGDKDTALFDGSSNVSGTIGDKLPAGVYFYTFYPNNSIMEPFQGDFYLSK